MATTHRTVSPWHQRKYGTGPQDKAPAAVSKDSPVASSPARSNISSSPHIHSSLWLPAGWEGAAWQERRKRGWEAAVKLQTARQHHEQVQMCKRGTDTRPCWPEQTTEGPLGCDRVTPWRWRRRQESRPGAWLCSVLLLWLALVTHSLLLIFYCET